MAISEFGGSLVSAGANVAAGFLGQASNSSADQVIPFQNQGSDIATQAAIFDLLGQIGFANPDLLSGTGPYDRLVSQINSLPITEKKKRRALEEIRRLRGDRNSDGSEAKTRTHALDGVLKRLGMTVDDVTATFDEQVAFDEQLSAFDDLGPLQEDVIRNRLQASSDVSELLGGLTSGQGSALQSAFREQILRDRQRGLEDAEEQILMRAQFGGFNPSAGLERIAELRGDSFLDAELGAIERAIQVAGASQGLLGGGGQAGLSAGQFSAGVNQGALSIAASQAAASNALNQQLNINNADSIANGVASAGNALGSGIASTSLTSQIGQLLGGSGGNATQNLGSSTRGTGSTAPASGSFYNAPSTNGQGGSTVGKIASLFGG